MVLPAVIILLCFAIFPLIVSIYLSLCRFALAGGSFTLTFIGLYNYKRLLFGSQQYHLIGTLKPIETSGWIAFAVYAAAVLYWLVRYARTEFTVLGFIGRLISVALATGLVLALLATLPQKAYQGTLLTTCIYVLFGVTAQFAIGLGLALLCAQPIRGRSFFRVVFFIPLMVTPVGVAYMFRMLADMQKGPFAPLSATLGLGAWSWADQAWSARLMVLIGDTWQWTPFMFIVLLAAVENQPRDQLEAARLDGASGSPDLPRHHLARDRADRGDRRPHPADRGVQDHRHPQCSDGGRPRPRDRIDDSAFLHRLADAGPRRLRGDRLSLAVCLHDHLRVVLQLRGPLDAEISVSDAAESRGLMRRLFEATSLEEMSAPTKVLVYSRPWLVDARRPLSPLLGVGDLVQGRGPGRQRSLLHSVRRFQADA